jgi:hypothetical protein
MQGLPVLMQRSAMLVKIGNYQHNGRTTTMDKTKLLRKLHAIVSARQHGRWLVKGASQFSSALRALNLVLRGEDQGVRGRGV